MHAVLRTLLLAASLVAAASQAHALVNCSVSAAPTSFGIYDPDGPDLDTDSGLVTVTCTVLSAPVPAGGTVGYSVAMSPGISGSYSPRRLQSGAATLRYNLYVSGTRAANEVWGDGTSSTTIVSSAITQLNLVGDSRSRDHVVYGRIAGNQSPVAVGTYTDAITLTLSF